MTALKAPFGQQLIVVFIHQRIVAVYFRPQIDSVTQCIEGSELKASKRGLQ